MQGVRTTDLPDGGHRPASDAAAADGVVLGHLPRDHPYPRAVGGAAATPAWDQLRDGLGALAQAAPGHGEPRAASAVKDKVEVDETYLGGPEAGLKGGRQLLEKALIVGAVEVRGKAAGRVRLQVVPDASARSLTGFVKRTVAPGTLILTDGWGAYAPLSDMGYRHRPRTQGTPERAAKFLPHIHRVFGNLKTWLRGTHHGVGHDHLQAYLDEFAFRFNRRRTPMAAFQTLLGLASGIHGPTTYQMLYASESTR